MEIEQSVYNKMLIKGNALELELNKVKDILAVTAKLFNEERAENMRLRDALELIRDMPPNTPMGLGICKGIAKAALPEFLQ